MKKLLEETRNYVHKRQEETGEEVSEREIIYVNETYEAAKSILTKDQMDFLTSLTIGRYDIENVVEALEAGVSEDDIVLVCEMDTVSWLLKDLLHGLSEKTLNTEHLRFFLNKEYKTFEFANITRAFQNGLSIELAEKYLTTEFDEKQLEGLIYLLERVSEEDAKKYATQPFAYQQFRIIADQLKKGRTDEQMALFASPDVKCFVMRSVCAMIDYGVSKKDIQLIKSRKLSSAQLPIVVEGIEEGIPMDVIMLFADKKFIPEKMNYIKRGYENGFSKAQLIDLAETPMRNGREEEEFKVKFEEILEASDDEATAFDIKPDGTSFEDVRQILKSMSKSLTGEQKKDLVDIILFS